MTTQLETILASCPLCGEKKHFDIFSNSSMAVYNMERHLSRDSALTAKTKPVKFCICENCGFVFDKAYSAESMYRDNVDYEASRSFSPYFNNYLKHTTQQVIENFHFNGGVVVEIGCGDGNFLKMLQKKVKFSGYGYDLTLNIEKIKDDKDLVFKKELYSNKLGLKPKLIVFRHIMEHINQPIPFLKEILPEEEGTQVFIEVPCWEWILKNNQFFAFNYEHCSYYTKGTLTKLLNMLGYKIIEIKYEFDKEYLHCFAEKISEKPAQIKYPKEDIYAETIQFRDRIVSIIKNVRDILLKYKKDGILWGAAGKGITMLNILKIDYNILEYVVDSNPSHDGTYIPMTGQAVVIPTALKDLSPKVVFLTNSLYEKEIRNTLDILNVHPLIIKLDNMIKSEGNSKER